MVSIGGVLITIVTFTFIFTVISYIHHLLHETDIVVFRNIAIFEQIRAFVLWHGLQQILDKFIWNKGVTEIKFSNIRLGKTSVDQCAQNERFQQEE